MSGNIDDYFVKILVAGSRSFNNYRYFSNQVQYRLELLLRVIPREEICFVSGVARSGADDMIIRWCEENGYPCFEYPADWDNLGKRAGFVRNVQMSEVCTHALIFWDRVSKGTKHMHQLVLNKGIPFVLYGVNIKPTSQSIPFRGQDGRKQKESRTSGVSHVGRASSRQSKHESVSELLCESV